MLSASTPFFNTSTLFFNTDTLSPNTNTLSLSTYLSPDIIILYFSACLCLNKNLSPGINTLFSDTNTSFLGTLLLANFFLLSTLFGTPSYIS